MSITAFASVPVQVDAATAAAGDPRVTDQTSTVQRAQLIGTDLARLTGLKDNTITATYVASGAQAVPCADGKLFYTLDGSAPTATSPSKTMTCTGTTPNPQSSSFRAVLTPADLQPAPINAIVTFFVQYPQVPGPTVNDDNGGTFFKYRLDKTQGVVTSRSPANLTGSSIPDAVITERKPNVAFTVSDHPQEGAINPDTLQVIIDNVDRRDAFDCTQDVTGSQLSCTMGYQHLPIGFDFGEGTHEVAVRGRDTGNTAFNETRSTFRFRVDLTVPVVRNVTATPNVFVTQTGSSLPVTSRGATINVTANVEDLNINTKGPSAQAFLVNQSRNLQSPPTIMTFDNVTKKWVANNVVVPTTWPAEAFNVRAKVVGFDQAGHNTTALSTADNFRLDPDLPVIVETPVGPFIRDTATQIKIKATDNTTGIEPTQVKIRFDNVTGSFKTEPTGATKVDNNTYEATMSRIGTTDNYTYTIPAPTPGSVITYQVTVKDKAGGPSATPIRTLIVDLTGPSVFEIEPKEFRSKPPHRFAFIASDAGAGVNNTTGKIFTSTGGAFTSTVLTPDPITGALVANVSIPVTDGATVKYYVEVKDKLGNLGGFKNESSPARTVIDLLAPTVSSVTAPATTSATPTFRITWSGTDTLSGIDYYTVQARVNDPGGTPSAWTTVANRTQSTGLDFCGEGGHTYEFRVAATDKAGNTGQMPANPQAKTTLEGAGCPEQTTVAILSPATGSTIDARSTTSYNVRYTASATRSFTQSTDLRIQILFSPDGQFWHILEPDTENTGTYSMNVRELPSCTSCKIQVRATTLTGAANNGTSGAFRILGGSTTADLDGNGLADAWETRYVGEVGRMESGDDPDKDGLSNLDESRLGTDPQNRDTDGDGASDRAESRAGTDPLSAQSVPSATEARTDEYTHWYWTIPGLFLGVAILFFVGLARRW